MPRRIQKTERAQGRPAPVPWETTAPWWTNYAVLDYWSNRENGQIVKRESPCDIRVGTFFNTGLYSLPASSNPLGNSPPGLITEPWNWANSPCYTRAYRKMKKLVDKPSSEMLLNIVERNKSLEMIAARAFQIKQILTNLKKGRLGDAWNHMSLNPDSSLLKMKDGRRRDSRYREGKQRERNDDARRKSRQLLKDVGSVILEWRYGIAPLMQDIASAIEVLQEDFKPVYVKATSGRASSEKPACPYGGAPVVSVTERVTIKGTMKITNPLLYLANKLGFVNPASVVWEAIPFSFLLDWFLPIGNFLQNFTDFVGVELVDGSITAKVTGRCQAFRGYGYHPGPPATYDLRNPIGSAYTMKLVRVTGITRPPPPPLVWGTGLTPGRALNAVALLLGFLNPKSVRSARTSEK